MTAAADRKGRGRRLILWRHGQTSWNVERRFQGTTDVELTETGIGQARHAARLLASLQPDAIVASSAASSAAWTWPTTRVCARPTRASGRG